MKFATYHDGSRDGQLWIVSRDLKRAVPATGIAVSLLAALEDWDAAAPRLLELYERVNAGDEPFATSFQPERCLAPLPRAPQWLDASAFLNHGRLMDKAFDNPVNPDFETVPLIYQGASDDFRGPLAGVEFLDDTLLIDMEGEFGVILADVPMGVTPEKPSITSVCWCRSTIGRCALWGRAKCGRALGFSRPNHRRPLHRSPSRRTRSGRIGPTAGRVWLCMWRSTGGGSGMRMEARCISPSVN